MSARVDPVLGIFVGGRSTRMGGTPKGLLPSPSSGEPLVGRLVDLGRRAGLEPVLVGAAVAYADIAPELARLDDDPPGIGPLGGLRALLRHAGSRCAIAVACDMPFVDDALLRALREAPSRAEVVAPRGPDGGRWEPLCARYDSPRVLATLERALERDVRSFQWLFRELEVEPLEDIEEPKLVDWDTPEDIARTRRS